VILAIVGDEHGLAEDVHPFEEVQIVDGALIDEVFQRHLHQHHHLLALHARFLDELGLAAVEHVERDLGDGTEAAPLDEDRFFVENFRVLQGLAVGGEHRGVGQPLLDELQTGRAVVHHLKGRPGKLDHVHLHAVGREIVHERLDEAVGIVVQVDRPVDQVHAHDAERLLLLEIFVIQHADMDDDLGRHVAGTRLEADAHPAMAVVAMNVALRGHRVREDKKLVVAPRFSRSRSPSRPNS
jgi:hypothetical protein